ncbi:MAG: Crp/Fnr family transcriptional regulator [Hyphomicrobiales bacterium]
MQGEAGWLSLLRPRDVRLRSLATGETLFRQGDPASAIYLVREGRVRLVRHLEDGSAVVLHVARPTESLAEASLFAETYHCDAVADVDCLVAVLPRQELLDTLASSPVAALRLSRLLAWQVRDLRTRLELRNIRSASERLLAWLKLRARGSPPTIVLGRTWTDVAAELGLTREAVYRALRRLGQSGEIRRSGASIALGVHHGDSAIGICNRQDRRLRGSGPRRVAPARS